MRPAAGKAFFRPDQKRNRSASEAETVIDVAPAARTTRSICCNLLGHFLGRAIRFSQQYGLRAQS